MLPQFWEHQLLRLSISIIGAMLPFDRDDQSVHQSINYIWSFTLFGIFHWVIYLFRLRFPRMFLSSHTVQRCHGLFNSLKLLTFFCHNWNCCFAQTLKPIISKTNQVRDVKLLVLNVHMSLYNRFSKDKLWMRNTFYEKKNANGTQKLKMQISPYVVKNQL